MPTPRSGPGSARTWPLRAKASSSTATGHDSSWPRRRHRAMRHSKGRDVASIAAELERDPLDVFFDIAIDEGLATRYVGKFFQNVDSGVAPLLKHRAGVITLSDAGAHLIYMCDAGFGLHMLAHWVRETGTFTLPEAIRRLTSDPAHRFRIPERGRLAVGSPADMLLFDPDTVGISHTRALADLPGGGTRMVRDGLGVHGVWVNGTRIVDGDGCRRLDAGPGTVLDRFDA
ncbi:MAG: amidohydrolase family protein [Burkholderiaceae bacterium]